MDSEVQEYTDEQLESFTIANSEASYFERAQNFTFEIKKLRIRYLGLKQQKKIDKNGQITTVWVKDKNKDTGINEIGVEECIKFLEDRMTKHALLTSWKEERFYQIIHDDMMNWLWDAIRNKKRWQARASEIAILRLLLNDILEMIYRRPIENKEREGMIPSSKEIMRKLGLDRNEEENMQNYPQSTQDKLKKEMGF